MKKYLAFLRGINVGNIRIKMPDLKIAFLQMGFKNVATFLQTGNVVFESDKNISEIKVILEKGLSDLNQIHRIMARGKSKHGLVVLISVCNSC